jgi:dolichol kinase
MPEPRHRQVDRNHHSAFWGTLTVFAVAMLGLVAYGYHGIRTINTASTTEGSARAPTPASLP